MCLAAINFPPCAHPSPHLLTLDAQVVEAEAAQPLVDREVLQQAGAMPHVLQQSSAGGGLVAAPAAQQRQEMYKKETADTGGGWLVGR